MNHLVNGCLVAMMTGLLLTSCQHKELCYDHHHYQSILAIFDWSETHDASPSGMVLYFYDVEGKKNVQRFDLEGMNGGLIDLTPGVYQVLCYNSDTEYTLFRGTSLFEEHQAYTAIESVNRAFSRDDDYPRPYDSANEDVIACPDMMWGCTLSNVVVEEREGVTEMVFRLHELVALYSYEIRNVTNVGALESYGGLLSGMANYISLGGGATRSSEAASVPFVSDKVVGTTLLGDFYTFGATDSEEIPNIMTLYVWMRDGQKLYYNFDVTQQVTYAEDPKHVTIIIDGLDLPVPLEDSGYSTDVDDWKSDEIDIEM